MKKIMFYINVLGYGGAERVISNLANQFSDKGYKCVMVTSYSLEAEYELSPGIHRINLLDSKSQLTGLKKNVFLIKKLRDVISIEKPDVMVSFMAEANFRLLIAGIGKKGRKILSVRNSPDKEYAGKKFMLAKLLFKLADGVVFQTEEAKNVFPKSIRKKSKVIYNQVDDKFYNVNLQTERNGIVTVGRLVEQKNHKLLIESFDLIKDKINDCLYIYGDGSLKNELENEIRTRKLENRVYLKGVSKQVETELCKYRLFVLSSDYEGMPNSLMEAMATGIACLSTDCKCGGPKELLEKEEYLYKVNNKKELSFKITELLTDDIKLKNDEIWVKEKSKKYKPQLIFNEWESYLMTDKR